MARAARVAQWLVTLGCLALLARLVDLRAMGRVLLEASLPLYLLAVTVAFLDRAVMILKWLPLLRVQVPTATLAQATRAYFAAGLGALLIPIPSSGEMIRAVYLGWGGKAVPEIGASIAMERMLGLVGSCVMWLLAVIVAFETAAPLRGLAPWVLGLLALSLALLLLPLNRRVSSRLGRWADFRRQRPWMLAARRFGTAYEVYRDRKKMLGAVGGLSFLEQFSPVASTWISGLALGVPVGLEMLLVAVPLSMLMARLPVAISGIGLAEGSMVYLLGIYRIPSHEALALALAGTALNFIVALPGLFLLGDVLRLGRPSGPRIS